jgi:gluconokinase
MIVVIMGVSGSGKSTIGQLLASELHFRFLDGDLLHPPANIEKMTQGIALTDADRVPWLDAIHARLVESFQHGEHLVVACSALKQRYREKLENGVSITWVYLKGSYALIRERLQHRQHHFMKAQMLASQFADLEEPTGAIVIDVAAEPTVAVKQIVSALPVAVRASNSTLEGNESHKSC